MAQTLNNKAGNIGHTREMLARLTVLRELLCTLESPTKKVLIKRIEETLGYSVNDRMFFRDIKALREGFGNEIPPAKDGVYSIRLRAASHGILPPSNKPLAAGARLSVCLEDIEQLVQQYGRIDRRWTTNRGTFAKKGGEYFELLVRRCVSVLCPDESRHGCEDLVRLLKTRNTALTLLIQKRRPELLAGNALLSKVDLNLLDNLVKLRSNLLKASPSVSLLRRKEAGLVDDIMRSLASLCQSSFVKTIVAMERSKLNLGPAVAQ